METVLVLIILLAVLAEMVHWYIRGGVRLVTSKLLKSKSPYIRYREFVVKYELSDKMRFGFYSKTQPDICILFDTDGYTYSFFNPNTYFHVSSSQAENSPKTYLAFFEAILNGEEELP